MNKEDEKHYKYTIQWICQWFLVVILLRQFILIIDNIDMSTGRFHFSGFSLDDFEKRGLDRVIVQYLKSIKISVSPWVNTFKKNRTIYWKIFILMFEWLLIWTHPGCITHTLYLLINTTLLVISMKGFYL